MMKRFARYLLPVVMIAATAIPAAAVGPVSGTVDVNYWIGKLVISPAAVHARQHFIPMFNFEIKAAPKIDAMFQYDNAKKKMLSDNSTTIGTDRFLLGGRYNFILGLSANLAYQQTKFKMGTGNARIRGFRIGGGFKHAIPASNATLKLEVGYGPSNKYKESGGGSTKANVWDVDFGVGYKLSPFKALNAVAPRLNLGYRLLNYKIKESATVNSAKVKVRGVYLGAGYDF